MANPGCGPTGRTPTASRPIAEVLARIATRVDDALDAFLPPESDPPASLHRAMRYGVLGGGKRLRPVLAILACETCGGREQDVLPFACAIECLHAYSLIHDDLPAMDNDDLRRGRPTCHKVFGDGMAILAGDALLTLAFEAIADIPENAVSRRLASELARAAGHAGMVGGQADDIEGIPATYEALVDLHARKTAALIACAARGGAIAARADDDAVAALGAYGRSLGLAFQAADDILDATGTPESLGKTPGKDARDAKVTAASFQGIEEARREASRRAAEARSALLPLGPRAADLAALADYVVARRR